MRPTPIKRIPPMNKYDFIDYVRANFTISVEAVYLIDNILNYVETIPAEARNNALHKLLDSTIGLSNDEINAITF